MVGTNDPSDIQVLTLAHLLIGQSYMDLPEPDLQDRK